MEIAHEPGLDAYQEHGIYKGSVDEVTDELCTSYAGNSHWKTIRDHWANYPGTKRIRDGQRRGLAMHWHGER